ncbi:pimeloyl-ACP methyl ester carboxylesterase [Saccharothrix tamanrassetensis]|uniref:Pimeloyl-ACP methyl ester carboxylesterase n=1 Tax=Saccharothrix tamanrassetensis TaxID=1051531 RepID=A0A841C9L8_9PSEU|nr:alpha/beta hydrolase [Saccharothrix tamanrassetensis]MBB5953851.1 pimeloyl-ACP methyl ester carboxylesterase [Saccharothrix tamanrassetensis]
MSGPGALGEGRTVRLRDADLHVYQTGPDSGPPVVLLHGFLTSALTWREVYPALAERHRVTLVDLPGCGGSPAPKARRWTADRAAGLLVDLFDALGLDAPAVVGSQMGGSIAAWLAATHPGRVSRLVVMAAGVLGEAAANLGLYRALAAPGLGPVLARLFPYRPFAEKWAAAHGPGFRPDPTAVRAYHRQLRSRGAVMARFGLGVRLSYGESFDALAGPIAGLAVPTLLLFGAADRLVPPSTGHRFAELIPGSRLTLLPDCGDFPQEEAPAAVAAAVTAFLAETGGRDRVSGAG